MPKIILHPKIFDTSFWIFPQPGFFCSKLNHCFKIKRMKTILVRMRLRKLITKNARKIERNVHKTTPFAFCKLKMHQSNPHTQTMIPFC